MNRATTKTSLLVLCVTAVAGAACGGDDSLGLEDGRVAEDEHALAVPIPGRIQAEDYKDGGEGVGYHDTTAGNAGGAYRDDDVDIQTTTDSGGGYNVGWIANGEWTEYQVSAAQAGQYEFKARVASGSAGTKTMHLVIDGFVRPAVSFSFNNGNQAYQTLSLGTFQLGANTHSVRFVADAGKFNINWMDVTKVGGGSTGVYRQGNKLYKDGQPFVSRGFTMIGLLSPTGTGAAGTANDHLNQAEMNMAKSWGANTLRFQISQRGFDPQDSLHSQAYMQLVQDGVALARQNGFVVTLSMQDQSLGGGDATPMPDAQTARSWAKATSVFNGDPYIIYEIFNEPRLKDDAASWQIWKNGGSGVVGHQQLVNQIRATGATNVLVAEGLRVGKSFKGSPLLSDPLGQMAYGIHPYLNWPLHDPGVWDDYFGDLTATDPVIATEWNATSDSAFCQDHWPTNAPLMLDYLKAHGIGLWAWALDFPKTLIVDWSYTPTNFVGFTCGQGGDGAGALVKSYFQNY